MTPRGRQLRRGLILPITLLMLLMLGLLAGSFAFRVHADRSSFNAVTYRQQTRLAAESGIQKVLLLLRNQRETPIDWYNNPDEFNRIIVWTPEDDTLWGTNEELDEGVPAFRFSIVADDPFDDEQRCRYGLTDESGKLNLNTATPEQLARLLGQVATEEDMIVGELVDALIDWRDEDDVPREFGAEADYYGSLDTPYRPKNGNFDTVEELLLVKGFDGRVLYGEDYDRNGIMTVNEDDTDESFPEDNGDGQLNRGLFPYVTVYSRDLNTDPENRARIYLYADAEVVRGQLGEFFESQDRVDFIVAATHGGQPQEEGEGPDESDGEEKKSKDGADGAGDAGDEAGTNGQGDGGGDDRKGRGRRQEIQPGDEDEGGTPDANTNGEGKQPGGEQPSGGADQPAQLASPAELLSAEVEGMTNPLTAADLPILMERTTTVDPALPQPGLVNVLTAPPQVLRCLGELTGEQIAAILQTRLELTDEDRLSTAWLAGEDVLGPEGYARIAPYITARSLQFTVESLGYADHVGGISRLQVVIEMRGPVPQVLYYRDLTKLGAVFPIREDEQEYGFGGQRG